MLSNRELVYNVEFQQNKLNFCTLVSMEYDEIFANNKLELVRKVKGVPLLFH